MPNVTANGIGAQGERYANQTRVVDIFPDECPICHRTIIPEIPYQGFVTQDLLEMYFRCPNPNCSRLFIALYRFDPGISQGKPTQHFNYERSLPVEPKPIIVTADISELSPSFVKIVAQAQSAEDQGLDEIAGPGFRKALEFLIKDFAISLTPDDEARNEIRRVPLNTVITKYLSGEKLPVVSKRAAWLGNDETHYERRWVGKDLQDLKKLIAAVEHFIAMEKLVAALPSEMPDAKEAPKA